MSQGFGRRVGNAVGPQNEGLTADDRVTSLEGLVTSLVQELHEERRSREAAAPATVGRVTTHSSRLELVKQLECMELMLHPTR